MYLICGRKNFPGIATRPYKICMKMKSGYSELLAKEKEKEIERT
jgi:hypothetical protein